uniref:Uncharacterized protein n=1 Tax=Fagus sylvatica TaxID=28930 RepID=A0A2N9EUP6_FAGSY
MQRNWESAFKVTFDWEKEIGVPGAFIIRNNHHKPLHYGGGNSEILNWWEPFTVSIIDVDVVVVGAEQDEGDAEPEFANVDSPGGDSVVELTTISKFIHIKSYSR